MPTPGEHNPRRDVDRAERIAAALIEMGLDAIACSLPSNVLMLTGYWPVVGTSIAVTTRQRTLLLAPKDELNLAQQGWADEVHSFESGSLQRLVTAADAVAAPLAELAKREGHLRARVGFEASAAVVPASYVAMHLYGGGMRDLLQRATDAAALVPADDVLARLRSVATPREVERIAYACQVARRAFEAASSELRPDVTERDAAARMALALNSADATRTGGHISIMSGQRSATAHGAYAMSSPKSLRRGELALVHCNSQVNGYWTDVTRTFCLGPPSDDHARMYAAVLDARAAALDVIRAGVRGRDVDRTARDVLRRHGFGDDAFKHPTGHGVGFAAIDHNARPRLHPTSDDVLAVGSVFNVEPAIYRDGADGMRHCDVVAVSDRGATVLTPFQCDLDDLVLRA